MEVKPYNIRTSYLAASLAAFHLIPQPMLGI